MGGGGGVAGGRGSVRNISYICSFINLANLTSCSEKARAVNLIGRGAKIRSSPQHCCGSLLVYYILILVIYNTSNIL